ncbi:lipoyl(octanoyl) transferase LipB [Fodinicurvata sediminis]|uniref:lipoyl(octanoyl) transferase LipB n=1 Tax=Fodinicurvata sediminis TaxID=1121832 RepID=UPI0003B5E4B7|nr:lipoyl(octanoyl) transferase LipB [Fodinicurvata sediminis]
MDKTALLETDLYADPGPGCAEWRLSTTAIDYPEALEAMEQRAAEIAADQAREAVWLLEHPPLYTAGTSADPSDLLSPQFPVYETGRGGQYTYHGPGQRVAYVMLNLKKRRPDVRLFVHSLEDWLIRALQEFNLRGERREGRVGIWIVDEKSGQEKKIAAIGVRVRRWVTFHGISLNLEPDLSHFQGIIPCGIREHGVTSLVDQGLPVTFDDLDAALYRSFLATFEEA